MAGITITLAGNFGKLDELKDRAHKTAASIKSAFSSNMGKAAMSGLAAGATAAFAGMVAAIKSAVDAGGELQDMMARTGAEGKGLMILQKAFENADMAASQVPQALNRMQKALAGVNEEGEPTNQAFAKLGLSVAELTKLDPAVAFMKIGEAIASIQSPTERAAIAMELFGKSGGELLKVFNDQSAFELAKQQLGGLVDLLPGMASDLDTVGDAFGSLDDKSRQLGAGIVKELMPALLDVSKWINETDFTEVGTRVGTTLMQLSKAAEFAHTVAKFTPPYWLGRAADYIANNGGDLTDNDKTRIKKQAEEDSKRLLESQRRKTSGPTSSVDEAATAAQIAEAERNGKAKADKERKAADEAERKAKADKEAADEKERSRAAAIDEYNIESAILSARIRGDNARLESLQREKAIREEIKRLESAGFTRIEARRPAEARVDAGKKAADLEEKRKKAAEGQKNSGDKLREALDRVREKQASLRYESSIGAISDMQRIGGGGGAVASGLDYNRQLVSLQQEANAILKQIAANGNTDLDV